jgi:hypothetical protein
MLEEAGGASPLEQLQESCERQAALKAALARLKRS